MSELMELLERVQSATGPDRDIDLLVCAHIEQAGQWASGDIEYALTDVERTTGPKPYTAFIDAALALTERVLPGWKRQLFEKRGGAGWIARVSSPQWDTYSSGEDFQLATAPLAILAATLQALVAKEIP